MDTPNMALRTSQLISSSLHFWWVAFLRCSKDYWWICQQKGKCLDSRLVKVWQDFGDVFEYNSLMHWWQDRGTGLFDSPQVEMDFVEYLVSGMLVLKRKDLVHPHKGKICIAIPLDLDRKKMLAAVEAVFKIANVRGAHYDQDAKYQLIYTDPRTLRKLIPAYCTWALKLCVEQSQATNPIHKWKSYEMGKQLKATPEHVTTIYDSPKTAKAKRSSMRTDQSRNNASALSLISNVEIGKFPSKAKVTAKPRWTESQQAGLDQAVATGQWPPKDWLDLEHTFMLPDQGLDLFNDQGAPIVRELAILTAMNNMEKTFLSTSHSAG